MARRMAAGVVGLLVAMGALLAWELAGHAIWPLPEGLDLHDPEQLRTFTSRMPVAALAWMAAGFGLGPFAGGLVASLIARSIRPAVVVGIAFLVATIVNVLRIPHPAWMIAAGVLLPLPLAWLGGRLALRGKA